MRYEVGTSRLRGINISPDETYFSVLPAGYVGPGDITSGALGWWGLRAYSAATAGNKAIRLRRDSDNTEMDFNTLAVGTIGALDTASITSFKGSANLFITKLYDQTGNGLDFADSVAATQIPFTLSAFGSFPAIDNSSSQVTPGLKTVISLASTPLPYSFSFVINRTGIPTRSILLADNANFFCDDSFFATANNFGIETASFNVNAAANDSTWHAVNLSIDGSANVRFNIDGTASGPTVTNPATIGAAVIWFFNNNAGFPFQGYATEVGLWGSDTHANFSSMNSNQHTYYGF
jgi:hypothetical protein